MSVEMQMRRLNQAREKVTDITQRRMRLEGELQVHQGNIENLEKQSREEFDCEVDDLPDMIEKLTQESEAAVARAEQLLGISA